MLLIVIMIWLFALIGDLSLFNQSGRKSLDQLTRKAKANLKTRWSSYLEVFRFSGTLLLFLNFIGLLLFVLDNFGAFPNGTTVIPILAYAYVSHFLLDAAADDVVRLAALRLVGRMEVR